jgi:deoxyribonuclease V
MAFRYPARIDFSKDVPPRVADAIAMQNNLRTQVRLTDDFAPLKTIAGVDVGYDLKRELTKAVLAVMDYETLTLQTSVIAYAHTDFPYISGLLAFREIPAIMKALDCLTEKPDLLMVDGQGVSHPRRLGIAAHLGVVSGLPAIGIAKSRLSGKFAELGEGPFAQSPLTDKGENIGTVLRSKEKCNPLFISAGHRISHETALKITLHCLKGYRLPEPTRIADRISKWALASTSEKDPPLVTEDLFRSLRKNV